MFTIPDLDLAGSRRFSLTPELREALETYDSNQVEAVPGPTEMAVMGIVPDLVLAREAWPHQDPTFRDSIFITMTADGDQYEFGTRSNPQGILVPPGKFFRIEPLELHWLRPDPIVSHRWAALQWVVPLEQESAFANALAAAVHAWNAPGFVLPPLGLPA